MKNNMVGIIIPAYNVEKYISKAIESCMGQTYQNLDIIVVDDGSSDGTYKVASTYSEKDKRVRVFRQRNRGVSAARNYALKVCVADYVIFLDSDDWIEPDTVEKLLSNIPDKDNLFLIASDAYYAYIGEKEVWKQQAPDITDSIVLNAKEAINYVTRKQYKLRSACYKLFSMKVIRDKKIRFDQTIKHGEDGLFVFEYLKLIDLFIYLSEPLWNILERPGSATQSPYNQSWLSAIDAVDKMIAYENSTELDIQLKNYKVQRMVSVLCQAIINLKQNERDVVFLRSKLRKECVRYMVKEKNIKNKLFYLFAAYSPKKILMLYCVRKG